MAGVNDQLDFAHQQLHKGISGASDLARQGVNLVHKTGKEAFGTAQDTLTGVKHEAAGILLGPLSQAHRVVSESRSPEAKAQAEANEKYVEGYDEAIAAAKAEEKRRAAAAAAAPNGGKETSWWNKKER